MSSSLFASHPFERLDVDAVEAFANTKDEDAEDKERDKNRKCNAHFHHQRMPRAPVAARISPFSSDMKPTICVTALRRVIIISNR